MGGLLYVACSFVACPYGKSLHKVLTRFIIVEAETPHSGKQRGRKLKLSFPRAPGGGYPLGHPLSLIRVYFMNENNSPNFVIPARLH